MAVGASDAPLLDATTRNSTEPVTRTQHVAAPSHAVAALQTHPQTLPESEKLVPITAHSHPIEGALRDIYWALCCISLPMLVLTAIFMGLVYAYKVSHGVGTADSSLGLPVSDDPYAYYVNYSATRLITVSSWTSTVTSFASSFVMALVSYPLAKSYLSRSQAPSLEKLPTPYQLRLIIGCVGGGFGSLWSWLQYCFWRQRSKQPTLLWVSASSLLGAGALSFAILAVDTWLHVTTSTISYDAISPVSQPSFSYGRVLDPNCDGESRASGVCIGNNFAGLLYFESLTNATETLMNLSSTNIVLPAHLDGRDLAYLTAADRHPDLDFQAKTFALSTQCTPVSKQCHLETTSWCPFPQGCNSQVQLARGMPYDCGPTLFGGLSNNTGTPFNSSLLDDDSQAAISSEIASTNGFFLQLFRKPDFAEPFGTAPDSPNPFYFATGARVAVSSALAADPEAVQNNADADYGFIFSCNSTFFELDYKMINGSFAGGTTTPVDGLLASNAVFTFIYYLSYTQNVMEGAFISGGVQSNNSQQFADFLAQRFSETTLSMVSGLTVASPNLAEQTRERLLVTRLPKAPFYVLIVLNLIYALLGIILAIIALASQPRRSRSIQARLSIGGVIAALLEPEVREAAFTSKKSNSGIEGAFAEYYNDSGLSDEGRVLVSDRAGNVAFEKIRPQGKDEISIRHSDEPVIRASSALLDGEQNRETEPPRVDPSPTSSVVQRKPVGYVADSRDSDTA
ncbi:hypothetical protein A1O7_01733 [Cladophialophora yegresii CBS 114405]|uniref:Uncharacterized protein n=1 Tax=Cladophialophora yegresii CBS 114405 TaxID=1182544 RepID=W9WBC1_9EURO|nr:uncharacterized protein A1O7_01733 [Cladophialophora yegresii CBS 114405]EXJ65392.1 hypothetical protein A1O7_01733 [Cladophialophora yegresii CBS 114405]